MIGTYGPTPPCLGTPSSSFTVTYCGLGCGFSGVALGVEYGIGRPGVRRVMEIANRDFSVLLEPLPETLGGGTGT